MRTQSSLLMIALGLVTTPARAQWPTHGEIVLRDRGTGIVVDTLPFFSFEAAYLSLKALAEMVDQASLTAAQQQLVTLKLPTELQRFDRLHRALGTETANKLIEILTGTVNLGKGSRAQAQFVACRDGRFCQSRRCRSYAPHGALVLGGMDTAIGEIVFSPSTHGLMLRNAFLNGVIDAGELDRLLGKPNALEVSPLSDQADLLVASATGDDDRVQSLDLLFSERPDPRANEFSPCVGHVHFAGLLAGHKNGKPLTTTREVNEAIDALLASGGTNQAGAEALRSKVANLGLPARRERSAKDPSFEQMFEEVGSLLGFDPRGGMGGSPRRIRISPEMIMDMFTGGQRGGRSRSSGFGANAGFGG
jgi:hypothetical protein